MSTYFDSSALAKLYVREPGTADVQNLATRDGVATSAIAIVELTSAIERAVRARRLRGSTASALQQRVSAAWSSYARLEPAAEILDVAAGVVRRHPLHALDAIHLASAIAWREMTAEPVTFATFDRRLWEAAAAEGFEAWPRPWPPGA